jgi:hypothetical protein
MRYASAILAALLLAGIARAQPPIDPAHAFSWQENCGWMNWIAGPAAPGTVANTQSVVIAQTYLAGWIWSENLGWVNLGAAPADGVSHTNADGADFGVNRDAAGLLSGFAWGENAGWVNFSGGSLASPPNPARLDAAASRFRGFAWGENIGWINLDDGALYVGLLCTADFDRDGHTRIPDIFAFLDAWFARDPRADINGDGAANVQDIFDFLSAWFRGC